MIVWAEQCLPSRTRQKTTRASCPSNTMKRRKFITMSAGSLVAGAAGVAAARPEDPHQHRVDWGDAHRAPELPDFVQRIQPEAFARRMAELAYDGQRDTETPCDALVQAAIRYSLFTVGPAYKLEAREGVRYLRPTSKPSYPSRVARDGRELLKYLNVPEDFYLLGDKHAPQLRHVSRGQNIHGVPGPAGDKQIYWMVGTAFARLTFDCEDGSTFLWALGDDERTTKKMSDLSIQVPPRQMGKTHMQTQHLRFLKMRQLGYDPDTPPAPVTRIVNLRGPIVEHLLREDMAKPDLSV